MLSGGGVYQPTTFPMNPGMSPLRIFRNPRHQTALLLFAIIALIFGIVMLASGTWLDADASSDNSDFELPVGIIVGGILMTCLGCVAVGVYLKAADWRRNCICPCRIFDKKSTRQLHSGGTDGCGQGIMALNPSTDPLVSHTHYAPSELPSLRLEDEERRNLMPETKDCLNSAEESDRMLEPDPRIVLRPICVEDQVEF